VRPHIPILAQDNVAIQLTGHKTEAVYRRYAIVSEGDLGAGLAKLGSFAAGTLSGTKGSAGVFGASRKRETLRNRSAPGWRNWQTHRT
jgi:hypothetical protein